MYVNTPCNMTYKRNYQEEVLKTIYYWIDSEDRFPIFSEDIETNVSLQINIWMINLGFTFYFWGLMGVVRTNFKAKCEFPSTIESLKKYTNTINYKGKTKTWLKSYAFNKCLTSSGQIISLKLRRSSGSRNSVLHVFGRFSSFKSEKKY